MNLDKKKLMKIQFFVFFIYLMLTTIVHVLSIKYGNGVSLQIFGGEDDGLFYWEQAQNVAAGKYWVKTSYYSLIIGNLIKVTGIYNVYLIRIFNFTGFILLSLLSIKLINIQSLDEKIDTRSQSVYHAKILLMVAFLLYPSLLITNFSIYRDIWIYMLYVLCTYLSIEVIFLKRRKLLNLLLLLASISLLAAFRGYASLAFVLGIGIYFFIKKVIPIANANLNMYQ